MKKTERKRIGLAFVISVILSGLFCAFILITHRAPIEDGAIMDKTNSKAALAKAVGEANNATLDNWTFQPTSGDAQLYIRNLDDKLKSISFEFERPLGERTLCQLYYSLNGSGLSEPASITTSLAGDLTELTFELPECAVYDYFRLDIDRDYTLKEIYVSESSTTPRTISYLQALSNGARPFPWIGVLLLLIAIALVWVLLWHYSPKEIGEKIRESFSGKNIRKGWKHILILCAQVGILILVGYLLVTLVYCLPTGQMEKKLVQSFDVLNYEGDYPYISAVPQDNFSDSIMLLTAAYPEKSNPFVGSLESNRYWCNAGYGTSTIGKIVRNEEDIYPSSYARYWHGYNLLLKPLMLFFNYEQIRSMLVLLQIGLVFGAAASLYRINKGKYIFALVGLWITMNPVALMNSLHFNSVFCVTMISVILICHFHRRNQCSWKWLCLFVLIGAMTSYFDLMTAPFITFGVSLALYFSLKDGVCDLWNGLLQMIKMGFSWLLGYGGIWAGKWVLATLFTDQNIIRDAWENITQRSGMKDGGFAPEDILDRQMGFLSGDKAVIVFLLLMAGCLLILLLRKKICITSGRTILYILIGVLPLIWYCLVQEHSYIHAFMTYRELGISIFAACCLMVKWTEDRRTRDQLKSGEG